MGRLGTYLRQRAEEKTECFVTLAEQEINADGTEPRSGRGERPQSRGTNPETGAGQSASRTTLSANDREIPQEGETLTRLAASSASAVAVEQPEDMMQSKPEARIQ